MTTDIIAINEVQGGFRADIMLWKGDKYIVSYPGVSVHVSRDGAIEAGKRKAKTENLPLFETAPESEVAMKAQEAPAPVEEQRPAHSPLGASGAERWMNCAGSVALLRELEIPEDTDEPDYRTNGVAAHAVGEECLNTNTDAWEHVGLKFEGVEVDQEIADAVQVYLDTVRPIIANAVSEDQVFVEYKISSPLHKDFYGTVDLAVVARGDEFHGQEILHVTDYKHGEGIQVDVEDNPQLMYYAYGVLRNFPETDKVVLRIVQPRGFHHDGQVREWETTAEYINEWAENVLLPAMLRTELDNDLEAGPWCRFCPAKLVCPMLTSLFGAACKADPQHVVNLSDESIGRSYPLTKAVKMYLKALEDEVFRRLNAGGTVPGTKLVHKKANRVWNKGASTLFKERFGDEAITKPDLKSPAEMEKIGPEAKKLVKEYAYTPQTGLTVALSSDKGVAVKVQTSAEAFGAAAGLADAPEEEDWSAAPADEDWSAAPADELEIPAFLQRSK